MFENGAVGFHNIGKMKLKILSRLFVLEKLCCFIVDGVSNIAVLSFNPGVFLGSSSDQALNSGLIIE